MLAEDLDGKVGPARVEFDHIRERTDANELMTQVTYPHHLESALSLRKWNRRKGRPVERFPAPRARTRKAQPLRPRPPLHRVVAQLEVLQPVDRRTKRVFVRRLPLRRTLVTFHHSLILPHEASRTHQRRPGSKPVKISNPSSTRGWLAEYELCDRLTASPARPAQFKRGWNLRLCDKKR